MILNKEEIQQIIKSSYLTDIQMLDLIQTYIKDKKGYNIQIKRPDNILQVQLMNSAFNTCIGFYSRESKEEGENDTNTDYKA